ADAAFSLEPDEFKSLVRAVRDAEKVLGKTDYTINETNRKFARSLYAVKDIQEGELFTPENVRSIRPSNGLHPRFYEDVIGKTALYDIKFGTPIKKDMF
ncbi:pseudaminic acid synthase, partial [bacterium]|nr:pseudaminic acid synthase [bacterium]